LSFSLNLKLNKKLNSKEKKQKYSTLQNISYILAGIWKFDKPLFAYFTVNTILTAILPFISMLTPKLLIDELTGAKRSEYLITILTGYFLLSVSFNWFITWIEGICSWRFISVRFKFIDMLNEKRLNMDFEHSSTGGP